MLTIFLICAGVALLFALGCWCWLRAAHNADCQANGLRLRELTKED